MASGSPNAAWASQTPRNVPTRSRSGNTMSAADRGPVVVQPKDRDQGHLQRYDQQADHGHEHHVASTELHPREGVRGEGGDRDRDHGRRDGHRQAVQERVPEARRRPAPPVVLERPLRGVERVREDRPPSRAVDRFLWAERRDQHAEGRDQPDEDHDQDRDPHEPPAVARVEIVAARRLDRCGPRASARPRSSDRLLLAEPADVPDHHGDDGEEQDHGDRRRRDRRGC